MLKINNTDKKHLLFSALCTILAIIFMPHAFAEDTPAKAVKLYESGYQLMAEENCKQALPIFEKLQTTYPLSAYLRASLIGSIYCQYQTKSNGTLAAVMARSFIKKYPSDTNLDYVYYLYGLASLKINSGILAGTAFYDLSYLDPIPLEESIRIFQRLVKLFPQSRYAYAANQRANYLTELLAKNEYRIAKYYFTYGNYVASTKRVIRALKNYPTTQIRHPLLILLANNYAELGIKDWQRSTEQIVQQNYPQSIE